MPPEKLRSAAESPSGTGDPAALLEQILERSAAALEFPASGFAEDSIRACTLSALDVPRLLAAVEAALAKADDWDAEGFRLDADAFPQCAGELREAIRSRLAGEAGNAQT